jgi:type IV secretory pathway VirB10-like protein
MNGPLNGKVDTKAWLQELKSNRKTQVALAVLLLALVYLLWPEAPKRAARNTSAIAAVSSAQDDKALEPLRKLGDLTKLERAGELPTEGRMYRDLFLFDMPPPPPPPPPKPVPPPPPPPPPTPEQLAAMKLAQERQEATNSRPQSLRYLGYMGRSSTGRIGSFARGEEILSLRIGDTAAPNWKLITLMDTYAEFQNIKFPDIRYRAETLDRQGTSPASPTNDF